MLDVRAWLTWALSVLIVGSYCRNPLYLVLLLLVVAVTEAANKQRLPRADRMSSTGLPSALSLAKYTIPAAMFLNGIISHLGDTILLRLPGWLPVVGGPITVEGLVYGAVNGLVLTLIFGAFTVFNAVTNAHDLVRLAPPAFHEAGIVMSIALTFMPQTTRSVSRIREAQSLRGHRVKGLEDWLPIVTPLLVGSLERSMGLAEAMVARGYGAAHRREQSLRVRLALVGGLGLLLAGLLFWTLAPQAKPWFALAIGIGAALIIWSIRLAGAGPRATHFSPRIWSGRDSATVAGALLSVTAAVVPLPFLDARSLFYSPYPRLGAPGFDPLIALLLLGLLVPAILAMRMRADD